MLKSLASRWFIQPFVQAQMKEKNQSSATLAFVRGIMKVLHEEVPMFS